MTANNRIVDVMCEIMEKYAKEYAESEKDRDVLNVLQKGISV